MLENNKIRALEEQGKKLEDQMQRVHWEFLQLEAINQKQ